MLKSKQLAKAKYHKTFYIFTFSHVNPKHLVSKITMFANDNHLYIVKSFMCELNNQFLKLHVCDLSELCAQLCELYDLAMCELYLNCVSYML